MFLICSYYFTQSELRYCYKVCSYKKKERKRKGAKDWKEDEVSMIELSEERPSLWDVFNKDYSKHDVKDAAYKKIGDVFG